VYKYFVVYKPFNVLSQFTSKEGKKTLKDFFEVPVNVHTVGRLDYAIDDLQQGVNINIKGKEYLTKKCLAKIIFESAEIAERNPPIRFRKNIPVSWLTIILTEGKNRQVRKMTAKIGFPTLRLIRFRIGKITIEHLQPGEMKMLSHTELYNLLQIQKR